MELQPYTLEPSQEAPVFLDWVLAVLKRKRLIVLGTILITILTGVFVLVSDPVYEATGRVISPQASSGPQSLLNQISTATGGMSSSIMSSSSYSGPTPDMLNGFVKSTTVCDAIIRKFDLVTLWGDDRFLKSIRPPYTIDHAREKLTNDIFRTEVDSASGIVSIIIDDSDAQRAANMANSFTDELLNLVRKLEVDDAAAKKKFYEQELKKAVDLLGQSEEALRGFQETTGAIQLDEQAKAVLDGIATLEAQIAAKEVQIRVMRSYATAQNPDLKRTQQELDGLREQRKKLEEKGATLISSSILPTGSLPALGTDYVRKMRDFKYNEALYLLLLKQVETSRQDEARSTYDVWVVDRAPVPQKKASPKMLLDLVLGCGIGFVLCLVAAFSLEYFEKTKQNPAAKLKIEEIKHHLKEI